MGFLTRLIAGFVAASTLGAGLAGTANAVDAAGAASDTTGAVTTTADDTGGRTVLDCRQSGEGATGPYADKFCWIDWSNLPLDSSGKPTPVRINVPGGHIDADATITHTDNAALTAKDYTGSKWSRLTSAYKLTGNTALAFSGRMGRQDPAASVTFSNVTPSADRTDTGVNVLKDFQLAFGDAEVMSGGVLQGHDVYERTDIESDKTLEKLGMIGSGDPNQSYSKANTGYGTTHVTLAGGPKGATDDANKDSKGAAVVGAKQASRFKVSFGQVNQHWDGWGSAIAVGVYMPYLTAYPLTYDKNASDAAGEVPSNQRGKENTTQPAKTKTNGKIRLASDTSKLSDHLVNSDFEYLPDGGWKTISARYDMASAYTSVDPNNGQYIRNTRHADSDTGTAWVDWDGFDASKFAWRTDQKGGQDQGGLKDRANAVELQQDSTDGNTYAEMVASETGRTIYQDLATIPGTLYKIRLKHASLCKDNVDQMQVVINGTPIEMTRVTANGKAGDKVGEKSTTIATKVTNENRWHHADQWETYEGYYVIPDGQTTTRFGFKAVNYLDPTKGNLLDDVTFARAYKLSYDKNSTDATGEVPSNQRGKENTTQPAKTKTSGTVKTVADTNASLPDHLVNGDFEYPGANVLNNKGDWWGVSRKDRMVFAPQPRWVSLPSTFDSDRFAWDSTEVARVQNESSQWHTNEVELQRDSRTGNMYAELCAYQAHTSIHQYIHTTPGTLYKVRLKHASLSRDYLDKMQVLIGPDGNEQPVRMTRVESQNGLDATGKATASTTVSTHASNEMEIKDGQGGPYSSRNHDGQWATYEGVYVATSDVTSFTFKSVDSKQYNLGNLLDDIVFDKAYRLSYDKNATDANGSVPSDETAGATKQAKAGTTGALRLASDDDVATYAASNLPKQLVNSDFDHDWRNIVSQSKMSAKYNFANIDPAHGDVEISGALNGKGEASKQWVHLNGFDASRFGWKSNQTDTRVDGRGGIVEIQRSKANDNMYAEITASQANTYLYQDIDTAHDYPTVYTVKLRYAHRNGTINSNEKIQILVGAPGHEQPVEMTRIASDRGNRLGEKSTTVNAPNTDGWLGSWDTFQGSVVVPAGRNVSRFTFKALGSIDGISGNLIDDVQFKLAYKLSYDKNSQDAFGQVPSDETANTVKQAKAKATGTVRTVADRTASGLTVHDLETDDVPGDYRQFVLNTTDTRLSQVEFENGAWYKSTDSSSQGMWPLKAGASLTIPSVGDWTDPSGRTHQISMTMRLKDWNGGSVSELYRFDGHGNIVGDGRFWINTAYGSGYSSLPAKVEQAMGGVDTSKRVGCSWTVEFTYADTGEKVPDTFKGVTGFNDLDGWDAQSDLKFEGVQLLDGFDGAYKRSDAELGTYGTNGFAGIGHDAGDEAHLNAPQQSRHRLAATWTGSTFTFSYDLSNPAGRTDGSRMTFGAPVTRTAVLTYDKNAADASGQVPSNTTPDTTQTASSKSTGKVSDLVQRTTTHEDGSVTVKTIDTSTDVVSGCQVYYPAGQRITLATMAKDDDCWDSSMLSRPGHTQLGWNQDRNATQAQAQVTMVEGGMTVYAVWVGNPVLTYDTNKPSTWSGQMPSTPASVSVTYNTAAADGSGWQSGDTTKIRGYRFLGWYTGPQDNAGLYDWTRPLTGSVTVYAHWQRLQANVIYNANGGTGSHANTTGWQYSDVTVPSDTSKSFKRDGYYFKYWNTQKDGKGTTYKDGGQVPLQDKDVTLYAIWAPYHTVITETGGVGLPVLVAAGMGLLVVGIGSTVMLTRRMRGEQ
ncbi:InlB B-repeat-containing protein [Bifidobacterium adolescentis]|uniref:InlB B-repeat-containing protein n=1 Tax=Bifidobacterium adolescentis TaxID=1680 RepID=UPI00244EE151|nr:InlB B-repeat-containing protein [Bifidobacterium adolescentis]WGJ16779.1 InlB B-repeat-containing protein [Bifidobacterium adolescentis]